MRLVTNIDELAVELGYQFGSLPTTYLGLPLGATHKSMVVWDGVEERPRKRLACWKRSYLSKGGRITLIRNTLSSMPIYHMSLVRMPKSWLIVLRRSRDTSCGEGEPLTRDHT